MSTRTNKSPASAVPVANRPDSSRRLIVIIDDAMPDAGRLTDLIEFMEAPQVVVAGIDTWEEDTADHRLAALMVASALPDASLERIFDSISALDKNVPIVLCGEGAPARVTPGWARIETLATPLRLDAVANILEEISAAIGADRSASLASGGSSELIGDSPDMRMIRALIDRVAPSQATVLVTGDSGTGKELIARQIHEKSGRSGEFVAINCGAIPDHLLESELFGHEKGAFTGAHAARAGRFELAKGGTLFLDEIGDMPTAMQVKLLRVLQERVIERVGGTRSIPVDIRVIAATHRNLQARIADGSFREDLFYRLSVFPIEIAPLAERPDDIQPLCDALIDRVAANHGVRIQLNAAAMDALRAYSWPGNVRELANLIERLAVVRPNGDVDVADLPSAISGHEDVPDDSPPEDEQVVVLPESGLDLKEHLASIERDLIADALQDAGGVVQEAAKRLGLGRTTLVEKIRRHELRN